MTKDKLSLEETREMFVFISKKMIENKDVLTKADRAVGDGDHGVGMARGFKAVIEKLYESNFTSIGEILSVIGMTLLTTVGGAAGAIFGVFFKGAAKNLTDKVIYDPIVLSQMLDDGLQSVIERGKAKLGDKTVVDALEPATMIAKEKISATLGESCQAISIAARDGKESTKKMIANIGKAKTLGERSIGYPDPGAISMYLILKFMSDYINTN